MPLILITLIEIKKLCFSVALVAVGYTFHVLLSHIYIYYFSSGRHHLMKKRHITQ